MKVSVNFTSLIFTPVIPSSLTVDIVCSNDLKTELYPKKRLMKICNLVNPSHNVKGSSLCKKDIDEISSVPYLF